uniref:MRH domain-containing protein n=1 Tax=Strigamia maritima TaxID=126957 RepID=T1J4E8_STRMM
MFVLNRWAWYSDKQLWLDGHVANTKIMRKKIILLILHLFTSYRKPKATQPVLALQMTTPDGANQCAISGRFHPVVIASHRWTPYTYTPYAMNIVKKTMRNSWVYQLVLIALYLQQLAADMFATCRPGDFHYEFTECDGDGRWRVSVPTPNTCVAGAPNPPERVKGCNASCDSGEFYNMTSVKCQKCAPGNYSYGAEIMFDSWQSIPSGFSVKNEPFLQSSFRRISEKSKSENKYIDCATFGWKARGDFIASQGGPCSSSLLYTVQLVKEGYLIYYYQHRDESILFQFENDKCQSAPNAQQNRFPSMTDGTEWKKATVQLKKGLNVLHWKTIGITSDQDEQRNNPVLIKKIEIYGVAYSSVCIECPGGSYSEGGASFCLECPENTFAEKGSVQCEPCQSTQYSGKGSDKCLERLPCTEKDYYEEHTPCDDQKQTQIVYKWIEPKICRDDMSEGVKLPAAGKKQACASCSPGMEYTNNSCSLCPSNYFSKACKPCPANTMPKYEYKFNTWNNFPDNVVSKCMSINDGCNSEIGWQTAGAYAYSATYHADGAYLILNMEVPGFNNIGGIVNGQSVDVGIISFSFELRCSSKCEFTFMQGSNSRGVSVIKTWNSTQPKQEFTHAIKHNDSYTFTWMFQKLIWDESMPFDSSDTRNLIHDGAKIYSIGVTNTIGGGASECVMCHQGSERIGCVPCGAGYYFDSNFTKCMKCPDDTYVSSFMAFGQDSCYPCGPGLHSKDGQNCYSDCKLNADGKEYDFTALSDYHTVEGNPLFTANGTQYYHLFNITLCGKRISGSTICRNNVTTHVKLEGTENRIESIVCRSTIVPPKSNNDIPLSTQSVSVGDHLLGITTAKQLGRISIPKNIFDDKIDAEMGSLNNDLNFFYSSPITTQACPNGRSTTITLRCNTMEQGNGTISLPRTCPDGTCDGCNFNLIWRTRHACATCTDKDFEVVKGECVKGHQTLHYIAPKHCLLPQWVTSPENIVQKCSMIPRELKLIGLVASAVALFLIVLLIYFWKKNRKLEYKYMKLVQSSNTKDGELPPAESCAIDDEEDDHFDSIQYKNSKSNLLFNKFRSMTGNKNDSDNPFETIQLTGKDNYS